VVGDTPKDIAAAHAVQAIGVGVAIGRYSEKELCEAGAEYVLGSRGGSARDCHAVRPSGFSFAEHPEVGDSARSAGRTPRDPYDAERRWRLPVLISTASG
jgi:hypothetical protein